MLLYPLTVIKLNPKLEIDFNNEIVDNRNRVKYQKQENNVLFWNRIYYNGKDKKRIKEITYILDESFPNPERKTMDRKNDFEIIIWSGSESVIKVIITTIDGNKYTKYFNFKFEDELNQAMNDRDKNGIEFVNIGDSD
jgi:hypothetical protein